MYFLALACRTLRWCGSPPILHAHSSHRPVTEVATSNGSTLVVSGKVPAVTVSGRPDEPGLVSNGSALSTASQIQISAQSRVPIPSAAGERSVRSSLVSEGVSNHAYVEDAGGSNDCTKYKRVDSAGADSNNFGDDDDDTSITEVTNDLLSLTYEYNLLDDSSAERSLKSSMPPAEGKIKSVTSAGTVPINNCESDDDVRSLYPDVVVISSSEEEIISRSSSVSGSLTCADVDPSGGNGSSTIGKAPERVQAQRLEEKSEKSCNDANAAKTVSGDCDDASVNSSVDLEISSPLKNASFVEKLEKLIGAQSEKREPSPRRPMQKSVSMVNMLGGSEKVSIGLDEDVGPPRLPVANFSVSTGVPPAVEGSKSESEMGKGEQNYVNSMEAEAEVDVSNIKAKLEKIFSVGLISPVTSPTVKNVKGEFHDSHGTTVPKVDGENVVKSPTSREGRLPEASSMLDSSYSVERDEVRGHMVEVLGTLRQKSRPKYSTASEVVGEVSREKEADKCGSCKSSNDPVDRLASPTGNEFSAEMDETRKRMLAVLGTIRLRRRSDVRDA